MRGFVNLVAVAAATVFLTGAATRADAHGGGLNAAGCHNDRKGGTGYHCHRSGSAPISVRSPRVGLVARVASGGSFRNCTAARAAGAAPVRTGVVGYGRHLDRDGDGVGCE